jgi:uncharacterized protein
MGRKNLVAAALACSGALLSVPAQADTKAGVDAWTRGDFPAAVRAWEAEAAKGDADALFNLGQAHKLGKGVPQDLAKAEMLFGQAAAMGHLQASDNYGLLLFQRGERARALPYIRAAADRGDPRAQYLVGIAHFNGDLVAKDWVRAYALVSLAQQQGLAQAASALAQMDEHVPMEQRKQAVVLAAELASQADATRARQLAAADLGNQVPTGNPAAAPIKSPPPQVPARAPTIASAGDAVGNARRVAGSDSPATAGADYARPATDASKPIPPQVTAPPKAATPATPRPAPIAPRPAPAATAPTTQAASGPWRIQLGAFGLAANADAMWARVKGRPELAGHPRLNVKAGAVTKLQAGGYASQQAAQAACGKLQAAGYACIAVNG